MDNKVTEVFFRAGNRPSKNAIEPLNCMNDSEKLFSGLTIANSPVFCKKRMIANAGLSGSGFNSSVELKVT